MNVLYSSTKHFIVNKNYTSWTLKRKTLVKISHYKYTPFSRPIYMYASNRAIRFLFCLWMTCNNSVQTFKVTTNLYVIIVSKQSKDSTGDASIACATRHSGS